MVGESTRAKENEGHRILRTCVQRSRSVRQLRDRSHDLSIDCTQRCCGDARVSRHLKAESTIVHEQGSDILELFRLRSFLFYGMTRYLSTDYGDGRKTRKLI